jgi:hypothetical protein
VRFSQPDRIQIENPETAEPGRARDPEQIINRLIAALDTQEVAGAVARLKAGFGLKVVK